MIKIDCSGVRFGSYLDEKHMFEWGLEIPGALRWEGDSLLFCSQQINDEALRDLIAMLHRYNVSMSQLAKFQDSGNKSWFTDPQMYWHTKVFGHKKS